MVGKNLEYLKSLVPKRLISTFDVFEKTAKTELNFFFVNIWLISLSGDCGCIPLQNRIV